jgi:hypothetical protein
MKDEMGHQFLLGVVVRQREAILELLACGDEALLIWGDAFLVPDLGPNIIDGVGGLDLKSGGLAGES